MKKIRFIAIFIIALSIIVCAFAEEEKTVQIKLGTTYAQINTKFGAPIKEIVFSVFWNNKKTLYRINETSYCIVEYTLNRAKNILFLEQTSEAEAMEKLYQKNN